MKKIFLSVITAALTLGAFSSAYADDHHHRVCHKVKVHGHWQNRCH
jgi:hypothetical protein